MKRFAAALLLAGPLSLAGRAAAADVPVVRVVPNMPGANGKTTLLSRTLPAGEPFDVEVEPEHDGQIGATVEVWPAATLACSHDTAVPDDRRQYHRLAMAVSGTGADRMFRVRIPILQVQQNFCVRVMWQERLDTRDLPNYTAGVADRLLAGLEANSGQLTDSVMADLLEAALLDGLRTARVRGQLRPGPVPALPIRGQLQVWLEKRAALTPATVQLGVSNQALGVATEKAKQELKKIPLPPAWVVDTADKLLVLEATIRNGPTAGEAATLRDLLQLAASDQPADAALSAWVTAMTAVANATTPEALAQANTALQALPKLPKPTRLYLRGETKLVPSEVVAENPLAVPLAQVLRQLERMATDPNLEPALKASAERWKKTFQELKGPNDISVAAATNFTAATTAKTTAETTLKAEIVRILTNDNRYLPELEGSAMVTAAVPGQGETPAVANYFTPAVGFAVTLPTRDSDGRAWLFPHYGLNVYFSPVDRKIPVGELIDPFLQRFSLIAALSLKDVTLPSHRAEPVLFGGFPYAGFGYRVTPFLQANVGVGFYRYKSKNPASEALHWGAAPGAGVSVDLDVVTVAKDGLKNL